MDQVSEIKQKTNIVDVIGAYVSLKKAGRNYKGLCPFHSEKTPSFLVSPDIQIYKCFGCGESGDVFSFVQKIEGVTFLQVLENLAAKAGVMLEKSSFDKNAAKKKLIFEINHLTTEFYHKLLLHPKVGATALTYLQQRRHFTLTTIKKFKLGFAPDSWDLLVRFLTKHKYLVTDLIAAGVVAPRKLDSGVVDKFRGRIIFPFMGIDGNIVGFSGRTLFDRNPKYLNTSETLVFHKSNFLFGLDKARLVLKKQGVIFVEGPTDVISASQLGLKNVVASSGTSLTLGHLKLISRYTQDIMFCFDSDFAGLTATKRAINLADAQGFNIKVAQIPENYKDLDELIHADSNLAQKIFEDAVPVYDFFLAMALRQFDGHNPIGKKQIMDNLVPIFSKISNSVVFDHYVKRLSQELQISETAIAAVLKKQVAPTELSGVGDVSLEKPIDIKETAGLQNRPVEEYFLVLLLHSDIDTLNKFLYKFVDTDFTNPKLCEVFSSLKDFVSAKRSFDIQKFIATLDQDLQDFVRNLYLWDDSHLFDTSQRLLREIEDVYGRIYKAKVRHNISILSRKLKLAELENNTSEISAILKEIKKFSNNLNA